MNSTEEFILNKYSYVSEPYVFLEEELIDLLKEFAQLMCYQQRQICADNAQIEKRTFVEGSEEYSSTIDVEFDTRHHRFIVDKDSILNAPEPIL